MSEYKNIPQYSMGLDGNEGVRIETQDFQLLKSKEEILKELTKLVAKFMDSNEIDTSETGCDYAGIDPMDCEYSLYTDMILELLSNDTFNAPQKIPEQIFEELVKKGFVSNGLIRQAGYYADKYQSYWLYNSAFKRVVATDEVILSQDELLQHLKRTGMIEVLGDNTYKLLK